MQARNDEPGPGMTSVIPPICPEKNRREPSRIEISPHEYRNPENSPEYRIHTQAFYQRHTISRWWWNPADHQRTLHAGGHQAAVGDRCRWVPPITVLLPVVECRTSFF